jgi:hypothetical protein
VEESVPEKILESGGHHDRFYGHAPVRVADLGAPAVPDARSIAWDLGQFVSDLSPITPQTEIATFVRYATIVEASHTLAPEAKRKLVVGGALRARPKVQAAWYGQMAGAPEGTTAGLLKQLGTLEIEGDTAQAGSPSQRPNWPRYSEGPTDSVRTFTSSFKLVAKAAKVPMDQWGATYISLLHGYAATIAISYLDKVADATFKSLSAHVMDMMERQHVQANKTALETRVLGPNEDLGDFANSLRVLTRRAISLPKWRRGPARPL